MAQAKGKPKKGDKVKITDGDHEGKSGVLKHIRAATSQGHVELEADRVVVVPLDAIAAA
ncbi:MAG: hypothetical protein ACREF4_21980 [Gammaproteobacteria bacterium]